MPITRYSKLDAYMPAEAYEAEIFIVYGLLANSLRS
jgi:hypothetical protein